MARNRWIYINGVAIPADDYEALAAARGHGEESRRTLVAPDLPDFRSPIDGKLYSGRAGLRDHNARHNVVNTEDLRGLPTQRPQEVRRTPEQVYQNKREIARILDAKL